MLRRGRAAVTHTGLLSSPQNGGAQAVRLRQPTAALTSFNVAVRLAEQLLLESSWEWRHFEGYLLLLSHQQ
jgi:hypothetical protein